MLQAETTVTDGALSTVEDKQEQPSTAASRKALTVGRVQSSPDLEAG